MRLVFPGTSANRPSRLRILAVMGLAILASGCFEDTNFTSGLAARIDENASSAERTELHLLIERRGAEAYITPEDPDLWLISGVPSSSCPLLREELAAHPAVLRVTECTKQP